MIVNNTTERVITFCYCLNKNDNVAVRNKPFRFNAGNNTISQDIWEKIVQDNSKHFVEGGFYRDKLVPYLPKEKKIDENKSVVTSVSDSFNYEDLNEKEAITYIESTFELDELKNVNSLESKGKNRKNVQKALKKHIEYLSKDNKDKKQIDLNK
jgi:hypothetical protein